MGVTHATSGAAVWLAATATLPALGTGLYPLDPTGVIAGALVCAGAALLPDADHHSATIAHSVPVLGSLATEAVGDATGGHRHGAHTLLAAAIVTAAALVIGRWTTVVPWLGTVALGPAIATVALICFAVKARGLVRSWLLAWLLGVVAAVAVLVLSPGDHLWFAVAVGLGYVTHIVGDLLTIEGVPSPIWPIQVRPPRAIRNSPLRHIWKRNGYVSVPLLGHAGSAREHVLGVALLLYCGYALLAVALQAAGQHVFLRL